MKSLVEFDAHASGKDEGLKEGRLEAIALALRNGGEDAAKGLLNASEEEIQEAKEWEKKKHEVVK
ncbi:MAG TPA: hypothetical protein DEP00_06220 [Lachnospiraceae bacterium]|jgi:hypothetical protein|nr:hypothetical protein [Lachnospiraceae bacterium]